MAVDTRNSIVIKKQGDYRGATKIWSNRYHFEGDLPADSSAWTTLADHIVTDEKTVIHSEQTIVEAIGYDCSSATSTNPHGDAVFTKTYTTVGTFTPASGDIGAPGDCASLVRYTTPARSTKNHPVYLMNYYHGVFNRSAGADTLSPTQAAALLAYANDWVTGFTDGTGARPRCGPRGAVALSAAVNPYVRHRDFRN